MKIKLLTVILFLSSTVANACAVCGKQQPKILRGITHGTGPESRWDYVIVWVAIVLVIATLFYSIKWLIYPGEKIKGHIKQVIFNAA